MAPIFIAGAGLAVDVTYWYSSKRDLQNAADAGALAGGYEILASNSQAQASNEAASAALRNTDGTGQVTTVFPSVNRIQVSVQSTASTFFVGQFLDSPPTISATAIAEFREGETRPPACLNLLGSSGETLSIQGRGKVEMGAGCGVHINSTSNPALGIDGANARLISDDVCINGGLTAQTAEKIRMPGNSNIASVAVTGCPTIPNPYQHLDEEIQGYEDECRDEKINSAGNFNVRGSVSRYLVGTPGGTVRVHPGTEYRVGPGAELTFSGGVNVFCYDIIVNNSGTLQIRSHIIFVNGARLKVAGRGKVTVFTPQRGEDPLYAGLSIISHSGNNAVHEIAGTADMRFMFGSGISVPGDDLKFSGNTQFGNPGPPITARSMEVKGNARVTLGSNPAQQNLSDRVVTAGGVRLVN